MFFANSSCGLAHLQTLALRENQLFSLPSGIFSGLSQLTELTLEYNELPVVPKDLFDALLALKKLYLYRNPWNAGFRLSAMTCGKKGLTIDIRASICP